MHCVFQTLLRTFVHTAWDQTAAYPATGNELEYHQISTIDIDDHMSNQRMSTEYIPH